MRIRSASYVVMAALLLVLTAACGGSPTASNTGAAPAGAAAAQQVYDQINGLTGTERTNTLLDLAKKDGTLSVYTSNTDMDDIVKAFEDKYGLKVESYRANSETVLQRVLQEASANYQGADLIVIGTHGRRGLSRALLGSVTESLLRRANCAVLAVRHHE